jgi:hypothetical protein
MKMTGSHANNAKTLHETSAVKVTSSHANNVKTLHETFVDEVPDSNPVENEPKKKPILNSD